MNQVKTPDFFRRVYETKNREILVLPSLTYAVLYLTYLHLQEEEGDWG